MQEVVNAMLTYYVTFLVAGNFFATSADEADLKKKQFASNYPGWLEAEEWFDEVKSSYLSTDVNGLRDFVSAKRLAAVIGQQYYKFNDRECKDLKSTLVGMEGKKAGRVRLPVFYKKALYTHWRFNEKIDYLRFLGALDESNLDQPQVILANYIMSRPNCLEASSLYAVCCRNECEDLMGHLERKAAAPTADAALIAELVANLPSDTVQAPRNLSALLLERLNQVAASNGGTVPIHGRLFAQWMHHAFPRECPYPHESGAASPQTPDEWMRESGNSDSSASAEEMWEHVQRDTCAVGTHAEVSCGDESAELPWKEVEELLTATRPRLAVQTQSNDTDMVALKYSGPMGLPGPPRCLCLALALLAVQQAPHSGPWAMAARLLAATLAALALDLLDCAAIAMALCAGLAFLGIHRWTVARHAAAAAWAWGPAKEWEGKACA